MRRSGLPALAALAALLVGAPSPTSGQDAGPIRIGPTPTPTASYEAARSIEREVHAAILAKADAPVRDVHIERALELSRRFADTAPDEADAHYWLAVSLGLETEYSGPFAKLTSGKECYEVTMRALELDPEHAGAHELLGRIHAGVMRLPWVVRKLGASLGMNDALGEASWESAEEHLRRAAELDAAAIAPRLELGKLLVERDRAEESARWFERVLEIQPSTELDVAMRSEAKDFLAAIPG